MSNENLKDIIKNFEFNSEIQNAGEVVSVYDGIVTISGLTEVAMEEVVLFKRAGLKGIVMTMDENLVTVMIIGDYKKIEAKDEVERTKEFFKIQVSEKSLGRVFNGFGEPIDEMGPIKNGQMVEVDRDAPPMIHRAPVTRQLVTGVKAIDCLIPVGFGQRELILGDMNTGKSSLVITTMLSQKNNPNAVCIYVSIGQKINNCSRMLDILKKNNVKNFIIVNASASEPASMKYLAPLVGCAIGEFFRDAKKDAILIYDNLSAHAVAYRDLSLIMRRPPGREAYPGDIFYIHAKLLERAAQLHKSNGGGSLTALPIVEILAGDISAYIPTNVISITDGQIILGTEEFAKNFKPAIKIGLSVSRIGGDCQYPIVKKLVGSMKINLAQFEEYLEFTKFSSQVTPEITAILEKGKLIRYALQQNVEPIPIWQQILILYGVKFHLFKSREDFDGFLNYIKKFSTKAEEITHGTEESIGKLLEDFVCLS